jgi:hypothetical protein
MGKEKSTVCPRCLERPKKGSGYCDPCNRAFKMERRRAGLDQMSDAARKASNARAYAKVYLKRGHIQRGPCEVPGCLERPFMHHNDFEKPLEIQWRCKTHRIRRGRKFGSPDRTV